MQIQIKLLSDTAQIPTYGTNQAAGADIYADIPDAVAIPPFQTQMIPAGFAISLPDGYFAGIYARSGLSTKEGLRPANCVGVIDADYTGPVMVALHNDNEIERIVNPGQRIAQMIIQPYICAQFETVEELAQTERGSGGFGSTGKE